MTNQIHPSDELLCSVLESAHRQGKKESKRTTSFRKPAIAILAIWICLFIAVPALAATVEPIYKMIYKVSPGITQFFMPVQKSDEKNGIRMEVVSAYIRDNTADIYITMQDLTGDRIDSTTDLFDSYSINRPFDSSATCQPVDYDEKTKTATFLISISEWGNQKIDGDKITFSVTEFLSHKKEYNDIRIPIDLTSVPTAGSTQKVRPTGRGGKVHEKDHDETETVLTPSQAMADFPVDGLDLSAISYMDGMLHIQTACTDNLKAISKIKKITL